jgi:MFS family permease
MKLILSVIAAVPSFVSGPLAGHLADLYGAEWVIGPGLLVTLPFFPLMISHSSLLLFIVFFTVQNTLLATGIGPIGSEFSAAARISHTGANEIHEFAVMNFVFGEYFDME